MFNKDSIGGLIFNPDDQDNAILCMKFMPQMIMPGKHPKPLLFREENEIRANDSPMSRFVVIDKETTRTDEGMSIGAVIADSLSFSIVDSRYYQIDPAYHYSGMHNMIF